MSHTNFEETILQQISDVSWLVLQGKQRLGILNKDIQEKYVYIDGKELLEFNTDAEVKKHFANSALFETKLTIQSNHNRKYYVHGYEVDYPEPFVVECSDPNYRTDVPLYTKIIGSTVYYAAGYYCINFEKGWKHARGPKFSTLEKYGYKGPFRSKIEVKQQLKLLNKGSSD